MIGFETGRSRTARAGAGRVLRGLVRGGLVLWVAVTVVFGVLRILPGDGLTAQLRQSGASQAQIDAQRQALCLDCPLHQQYASYLHDLLRGDFGLSTRYLLPVRTVIASQLAPTLTLGLAAFGVALMWGVLVGIANGVNLPGWRGVSEVFIVFSQAVPVYVTGVLGIYLFSLALDWLPAVGATSPQHLILPAGVLGLHVGGDLARVLGSSLRDVLAQPYMLAARARGLPPLVLLDHALRVALLPVLSVLVLQAGFLLGGTVLIEFIFVRPGLGSLLREAVLNKDYAVVQALVIFSALIYLLASALSGWLRMLIDPRLRR